MDLEKEIKNCFWVGKLDDAQLEQFINAAEIKNYYKNGILFKEDDPGDSVFILIEGKVYLEKRLKNHKPVPPTQITIVKRWQIFGEMGFVENQPRSATARAKSNVKVLEIKASKLQDLISKDADFGLKIMTSLSVILSKRLRRMNEQWLDAVAPDHYVIEYEYQM